MSYNFEQALAKAREIGQNARVGFTLATNQGSGLVSYAMGELSYSPPLLLPEKYQLVQIPESLHGENIPYLFSDREINMGAPRRLFGDMQPFSVENEDKLGISLHNNMEGVVATFILETWGNAVYHVVMKPIGDLLYGYLAPAIYTLSFQQVSAPPK